MEGLYWMVTCIGSVVDISIQTTSALTPCARRTTPWRMSTAPSKGFPSIKIDAVSSLPQLATTKAGLTIGDCGEAASVKLSCLTSPSAL